MSVSDISDRGRHRGKFGQYPVLIGTHLLKFPQDPVPSGTEILKYSWYPVPSDTQFQKFSRYQRYPRFFNFDGYRPISWYLLLPTPDFRHNSRFEWEQLILEELKFRLLFFLGLPDLGFLILILYRTYNSQEPFPQQCINIFD